MSKSKAPAASRTGGGSAFMGWIGVLLFLFFGAVGVAGLTTPGAHTNTIFVMFGLAVFGLFLATRG